MQIRRVMTSMMFATKMVKYWKNIFLETLNQCSSSLTQEMYITKETKWYYGAVTIETIVVPVSFCQKPSILERGTKGPAWNRHGSHIVLTLIIRFSGVDGPWSKQRLGILILIKTGPAAKLLSWWQCNRCHLASFVTNISGAKFEEHCIYCIFFSTLPF